MKGDIEFNGLDSMGSTAGLIWFAADRDGIWGEMEKIIRTQTQITEDRSNPYEGEISDKTF